MMKRLRVPVKEFILSIFSISAVSAFSFSSTTRVQKITCNSHRALSAGGNVIVGTGTIGVCKNNHRSTTALLQESQTDQYDSHGVDRRQYLRKALIAASSSQLSNIPASSYASTSTSTSTSTETNTVEDTISTFKKGKSRTQNYEIQHSSSEWTEILSASQFNVLRRGGTERQRGSILEKEKRQGTFICAGCTAPLFASSAKFDSGTGWPSFDSVIDSSAVELEEVSWIKSIDGAEVRCRTCGGHLGDLFPDGWRYAGSKTGKRYCINGAALVFRPADGGKDLRGDIPPPNKVIQYEPSLRRD